MVTTDSNRFRLCAARLTLGALCALLPIPGTAAAQAEAVQLAAEVATAYQKSEGFLATYWTGAQGNTLEITLGADHPSGIFVARIVATTPDGTTERRLWSPAPDVVYAKEGNHDAIRIDNLKQRQRLLQELAQVFAGGPAVGGDPGRVWLRVLLTKEGFESSLSFPSSEKAMWPAFIGGGASVTSQTDQEVAFKTADYGIVRISRQTGLVVRQVLKGEAGPARVLEQRDFKPNPGRAAVSAVFAGWQTTGAEPDSGVANTLTNRLECLQSAINAVDLKGGLPEDFKARLASHREFLRRFAKVCLVRRSGFLYASNEWVMLNLENIRAVAAKQSPGVPVDVKQLAASLSDPLALKTCIEGFGTRLAAKPPIQAGALGEILGTEVDNRLHANTPAGEQARKSLEAALVLAYCDAMAELKLAEFAKTLEQAAPPTATAPPAAGGTANKPVLLKIDRPEKVGKKSTIAVKSTTREHTETQRAGALPTAKQTYGAGSLRAKREVLAVGPNGRATKLRLTIQSLSYTDDPNAAPGELAPSPRDVVAELKQGETVFTEGGQPAGARLDEALQHFELLNDGLNYDVMLNAKSPHAIGDEWLADIREVTNQRSLKNLSFDPKASTGKVRLTGMAKVGGIECYLVTCEMTLVPSGVVGQPATGLAGSIMKFTTSIPVPVDPAISELGTTTVDDSTFKFRFRDADGTFTQVESTTTAKREEEITPK